MKKFESNPFLFKSFNYAVHIVKHTRVLKKYDLDPAIISQFIRSGTSIGANLEEAIRGSSKRDFTNKLNISYKEARESKYWVRLLHAVEYMDDSTFNTIFNLNSEIQRMLYASIRKSRKNINEHKGFN